jgi:rubrerythrin
VSHAHTDGTDTAAERAGGRATGRYDQGNFDCRLRRSGRGVGRDPAVGVTDVAISDWLPTPDGGGYVHYECRECGRNLTGGDSVCPVCDGDRAEYRLD